jgi:hypothetical protein
MANALIGFSGFVGSILLKQATFDLLYRSTNIGDIEGQSFDTLVCAGAPAQKWIANREPEADRQKIDSLIGHLETIQCATIILISTVDVFKNPIGVDEDSRIDEEALHAYGLHRRLLEKFVERHFKKPLIVRLPGLVGPGLRKNIIFDFLNDNDVYAIDSRGIFQFYPMVNLWYDIQTACNAGLELVHLTAEPISVADIAKQGFGKPFDQTTDKPIVNYDMRTRHTQVFGALGHYQYSARETIQAVRAYAQSEPRAAKSNPGADP